MRDEGGTPLGESGPLDTREEAVAGGIEAAGFSSIRRLSLRRAGLIEAEA